MSVVCVFIKACMVVLLTRVTAMLSSTASNQFCLGYYLALYNISYIQKQLI